MQFFGFGGAPDSDNATSPASLAEFPGQNKECAVVVDSQRAQLSTPVLRKSVSETDDDNPKDRIRKIERRAAATQQRSLDKKIQALNEEMAEVEALLNRSVASRQADPSVTTIAERRKQDLKDNISAVATECVVKSVEVSIGLNANDAAASAAAASPGPAWAPVGRAGGPEDSAAQRKSRASGVKRLTPNYDSDDKYRAKTGRPGFQQALLVYFGATAAALPLPVAIQRSGASARFSPGRAAGMVVALSSVAGVVIYLLFAMRILSPTDGARAHWG